MTCKSQVAIHRPEVKPRGLVAYGPLSFQTRMVKHQCHRMTMSRENARRKSAYGLRWTRLTGLPITHLPRALPIDL